MIYFIGSVILLILGYVFYGAFVAKIFGVDPKRPTPAHTNPDGVDYVPMPRGKIFLIQLLNIAGLGPVVGPLLGALYGPVALPWVVFGCILGGAVHDYCAGMISLRWNGASYPEIIGRNLGLPARRVMEVFSVLFMILVGAVFVLGPAELLASMTGTHKLIWIVVVFAYYFLATILPIHVVIGRIYPFFAALLLIMAVGLIGALIIKGHPVLPNTDFFVNQSPEGLPIWPLLFITIACGAISGFHATQSPMMARCLGNESYGRSIFYGAMIAEGLLALIWVTLGLSFYESPQALYEVIKEGAPNLAVERISKGLLGPVGGILAILGVVVLPITSGDTAFRSARLMLADAFRFPQGPMLKRLIIAVPLFAAGIGLTLIDFGKIWRYFGWSNQTMACITLWAVSVYLARRKKLHWITSLPAAFMTAVCVTFLLYAKIGFSLPMNIAGWGGVGAAVVAFAAFLKWGRTMPAGESADDGPTNNARP